MCVDLFGCLSLRQKGVDEVTEFSNYVGTFVSDPIIKDFVVSVVFIAVTSAILHIITSLFEKK